MLCNVTYLLYWRSREVEAWGWSWESAGVRPTVEMHDTHHHGSSPNFGKILRFALSPLTACCGILIRHDHYSHRFACKEACRFGRLLLISTNKLCNTPVWPSLPAYSWIPTIWLPYFCKEKQFTTVIDLWDFQYFNEQKTPARDFQKMCWMNLKFFER